MPETPTCPRCGYDLSGHTASWETSCPLEGQCPECGLIYCWSDVFLPLWVGPRWSFEHQRTDRLTEVQTRGLLALRLIQTLGMTFLPWKLWREIRLAHRLNGRRLVFLSVIALFILHITCVMIVLVPHWIEPTWRPPPFWTPAFPYNAVARISCGVFASVSIPIYVPVIAACMTIVMPLSMLLLRASFARIRVRRTHIARGAALSLPLMPIFVVVVVASIAIPACLEPPSGTPSAWLRNWIPLMGVAIMLIALWVWWWMFLRLYVHMRHAWFTSLLLMFMSALFLLTTTIAVSVWMP